MALGDEGYKALLTRTLAKVNEMISDIERHRSSLLTVVDDLYEIKHELESVGTRPNIRLKTKKMKGGASY
jgi:hypothetical protein